MRRLRRASRAGLPARRAPDRDRPGPRRRRPRHAHALRRAREGAHARHRPAAVASRLRAPASSPRSRASTDDRLLLRERARFANERGRRPLRLDPSQLVRGRPRRPRHRDLLPRPHRRSLRHRARRAARTASRATRMADVRRLLDAIYADLRQEQSQRLAAAVQRRLVRSLRELTPRGARPRRQVGAVPRAGDRPRCRRSWPRSRASRTRRRRALLDQRRVPGQASPARSSTAFGHTPRRCAGLIRVESGAAAAERNRLDEHEGESPLRSASTSAPRRARSPPRTAQRHVVDSYVGWPLDMVARKVLKKPVLIGAEALENRTMLDLHRPLEQGLIKEGSEKDVAAVRELLAHLIGRRRRTAGNGSSRVRAVVGVPAEALRVNKQQLRKALRGMVDSLMIVSEPFAVAYGIEALLHTLIIDIGAGTTDFCVMKGRYPTEEDQRTLTKAGDSVDEQLVKLIARAPPRACSSRSTWCAAGRSSTASSASAEEQVVVRRRSHGKPTEIDITDEMRHGLREPAGAVRRDDARPARRGSSPSTRSGCGRTSSSRAARRLIRGLGARAREGARRARRRQGAGGRGPGLRRLRRRPRDRPRRRRGGLGEARRVNPDRAMSTTPASGESDYPDFHRSTRMPLDAVVRLHFEGRSPTRTASPPTSRRAGCTSSTRIRRRSARGWCSSSCRRAAEAGAGRGRGGLGARQVRRPGPARGHRHPVHRARLAVAPAHRGGDLRVPRGLAR